MPWIHATLSAATDDPQALAAALAREVALVTGLRPGDVVALVSVATAASGSGAVIVLAGANRGDDVEASLVDAVRRTVAEATGVSPDLVAVLRL